MIIKIIVLILLMVNITSIPLSYGAERSLIFGVFPRWNARVTFDYYQPIADYLSEKLGYKVILETEKDFSSFWKKVKQKRYDLVHYNQYHYVKSHKEYGYEVIVKNQEFGKDTLAPALIARVDSGIKKVSDLKGKKVSFGGGKLAMVAYVGPKKLLHDAGLNDGDYVEQIVKNPPTSAIGAYYGYADASGSGEPMLKAKSVTSRINTAELFVLAKGEELPHLPWAVKEGMDLELRDQIKRLLIELNKTDAGKAILHNANLTGLTIATDEEYDICRKIIKEVIGEVY